MSHAEVVHERLGILSTASEKNRETFPFQEVLNNLMAVSLCKFEFTAGLQTEENVLSVVPLPIINVPLFEVQVECLQKYSDIPNSLQRRKLTTVGCDLLEPAPLSIQRSFREIFSAMETILQMSATLWEINTFIFQYPYSVAVN